MRIKTFNWYKFFFRLTLVFSILISIVMGWIQGMEEVNVLSYPNTYVLFLDRIPITNPVVAFLTTFMTIAIIGFILIFASGRVLYFTIRWIYKGLIIHNKDSE